MNCLHIACEEGHRKTVETILDYSIGIDVNERTEEGTTALHLACKAGNFGTIRLLIRSNADINALDKLGNTPAHYLAKTEYRDVVQWLTERKPNLSIRNSDGKQAWQYASNARIADLLRPIGLNRPSLEDYTILGQIGQGSFAKVYLASSRGEKFAIKAINKSKIAQKKAFRYIFTERKITTTTRHPFIVSATKAFQNTEYLFLVLPYYPHGDLAELLKQYRRFKEEKAILWFAQVVCAIEYLHANGIVHRDIKLSNVVIDSDGFCKLIDFGLSRYGITKTTIMESVLGTVAYLPPEMVAETGHNFLVDSYNLGTMLYEMLCGQPPFWAYERKQLLENIKSQELTFPQYVSPVAQNLLCKLLNRDQTKRLTIQGIKEHPFLSGINWADILAQRFTPPSTKPFVNKFKKVEPPKFSNTCDRTYYIQKWDYF